MSASHYPVCYTGPLPPLGITSPIVTFPIVSADEFAQKLECEPIYLKDLGIRSNLPYGPERKGKGGKVKRW